MNKSQKTSAPVARQPKPLSEQEKQDLIIRKLAQIKAAVSQAVINNLCAGKGPLSDQDCDAIVDNAIRIADRYVKTVYMEASED